VLETLNPIYEHFITGFEEGAAANKSGGRRIGAELKFPVVNADGTAVRKEIICDLWQYLQKRGWKPLTDALTGEVSGASTPGERNDTVASCETGFCKSEFSTAHVPNLFELSHQIDSLRKVLREFGERKGVCFLGYGIQPLTPPSKRLAFRKTRSSVWETALSSNRCIPREFGDDVHLFTINSATHVHLSVTPDEAVPAVNVLNGFAGAQIALTAHSNLWLGHIDKVYRCVAEKFWDWWMPDGSRVGVPPRPFNDLTDYVNAVASLRPIYVERAGRPLVLTKYETFDEYYHAGRAVGLDSDGREVSIVPAKSDIDLHNSCYWYNARISRYYTVENRCNDQQPPQDLICVAALTLGLAEALPEAEQVLAKLDWQRLRASRELACRAGLSGGRGSVYLADLAGHMLKLAELGLRRRGLGEEKFLAALEKRLRERRCPADEVEELFNQGSINALISERRI